MLRAEPFLKGHEDEEVLRASIVFDVVRKGGQEGTYRAHVGKEE